MFVQQKFLFLYFYFLIQIKQVFLVNLSFKNGVIGEPNVDCGINLIKVFIQTENEFKGRLYVEEELEQADCIKSYSDKLNSKENGTHIAEFSINLGHCNMRRQRILNPRGVTYSFTLVISFHQLFLTGVDKAFHIKCFFLEAVKAVNIALDVSSLTTKVVEREFALPQCNYYLKQNVNGPVLKFANIGEPITHVWECTQLAGYVYGILIHSCYVDDGRGNHFELVDEKGCAIDRYLLDDIAYNEQGLSAHVNSHVFRYADRIQLYFTCTLQLCFKDDGGCDGITPPKCSRSEYPKSKGAITAEIKKPVAINSKPNQLLPLISKLSNNSFNFNLSAIHESEKKNKTLGLQELILLGNSNSSLINETEPIINGTVRTSRAAGNMETDLSIDLTVLPLHDHLSDIDSLSKNIENDLNLTNSYVIPSIIDQYNNSILEQSQLINSENMDLNSSMLSNFKCLNENNYLILTLIFVLTIIFTTISTTFVCFKLQKWKSSNTNEFKF